MSALNLSLAIGEYDHVRDVLDGSVRVTGVELTVLRLPIEEIFYRATMFREFDISEMSFAKVIGLHASGDRGFVPLPVFPSRVFRHSSIYVGADSALSRIEDLAGKRIGVPEWAQTAAVYSRGMLAHDCGIDLRSIEWFQAGVNEAGRKEKLKLELPPGIKLTVVPDRSLSEMLVQGSLDAILSARPPAAIRRRRWQHPPPACGLSASGIRVREANRHFPDHARRRDAPRRVRSEPLDRDEPL